MTFVVDAQGHLPRPQLARHEVAGEDAAARGTRRAFDAAQGSFVDTATYAGPELRPGNRLPGPAIIEYPGTTVVVLSGQHARVDELLGISITR